MRLHAVCLHVVCVTHVTHNCDTHVVLCYYPSYYVNDKYFDPATGPIFLGIRGEGPISGPPAGWVNELAQQHNALTISVEHRFYGKSVPGNNFTVANLAFLNLDDALADYVAFIDFYKTKVRGLLARGLGVTCVAHMLCVGAVPVDRQ